MKHRLSILLIFFPIIALAGTTGKIKGRVTDRAVSEPLINATVMISGTQYGAVTDLNGDYIILNVPAGSYQIRFSFLGYQIVNVTEVKVMPDLTTEVNAALVSEGIEMGEVTITAERKAFQKDATATLTTIDEQQIKNLPINNFTQALVLVTGFVNSNNNSGDDGIHLRGGRSGEITYLVDGIRVDDPIYGGLAIDLPRAGVSSLTVMSGTFNAEYGQAQSGVVNITTPEGSSTYQASARFGTDNFGIESNSWNTYRTEFTIGGPVPIFEKNEALNLFVSGDQLRTQTYLNNVLGPEYTSRSGRTIQRDFNFGLFDKKERISGKMTSRLVPDVKINASASYSVRNWNDYDHYFKQYPEYNDRNRLRSELYSVAITHTLNPSTYYEVKFSYFAKHGNTFTFEDDLNEPDLTKRFNRIFYPVSDAVAFDSTSNYEFAGFYAQPLLFSDIQSLGHRTLGSDLLDTAGTLLAKKGDVLTDALIAQLSVQGVDRAIVMVPSVDNFFEDSKSKSRTIIANFTSQIDKNNLVKAGVELKFHTINNFWISGINSYWDHIDQSYDFWKRHAQVTSYQFSPVQLSAYVQDKLEYDDIILNLGIRLDYLDSKAPDIYSIINDPSNASLPDANVKPKLHVSPRLGFAHPITEKIKFRFSYGQFYQYPDFNFLYRRFNQLDQQYPLPNLGQGYEPSIGNPNLKPEVTHAYEFGGEFELIENLSGSMTLFYKDTYDYISTSRVDVRPYAYTQIVNLDYANTRGIELSLRKRLSDNYSFQVNYTYSRAEGNADYWQSHADEAYLASVYGIVAPKKTVTLGWDQPHTLNFSSTITYPSWGVSFIGQFGSGLPYTPADARGKPIGERNSDRQPWTGTLDMRIYKQFKIEPVTVMVYSDVDNLLNRRNVYNVFSSTGRPDYSANPNVSPENIHRPNWFGPSRHAELGIEINFE
jgi:outer membrane receptor protein involved in Fe transport